MTFFQAVRSCWALFLSFAIMVVGHGLLGSLLGVRLTLEGFQTGVSGLVLSGYFLGMLLGALLAPRLIERVGHVRVFAAMSALACTSALIHATVVDPWLWFALRIVTGLTLTSLYVLVESWVNDRAENNIRAQLLAVYMILWLAAMAGGQLLIDLDDPGGHLLFLLVAGCFAFSAVPLALATEAAPDYSSPARLPLPALWRVSPLATISALVVGLTHGTIGGMSAVFAATAGYDLTELALFTASFYVGAIVLQLPIAWLSDHMDRRLILAAVALAAAIASGLALTLDAFSFWGLIAATALLGGFSLPLNSLTLALANDRLSQRQMVSAAATLYLLVGTGCLIGPMLTGWTMEIAGNDGFYANLIVTHGLLGLYALWHCRRSEAVAGSTVFPYSVPVVPPPTMAHWPLLKTFARPQAGSATQ